MKYMCLVYIDSAHPDVLPACDAEAATEELVDFREQLRASGYYVSSGALRRAQTAAHSPPRGFRNRRATGCVVRPDR